MSETRDLKISIEAVNNAKKTLTDVQSQLGNITKANESVTASVFKAVASWDLLKKAMSTATQFLGSSVKESMETARMMAQVKINVENAGFAYDELAPKMKAVGDSALKLGFDDDVAQESLSRLLLVTKDMTQAQALFNLSMDLSRNKNISLEEATKAITLVTQGNSRALKELGIDLKDGATTAELLIEAQEKLKGSAGGFADTTAGKMATLNQQWDNMKQQIGDGITPAISKFLGVVQSNMPTIIELFNKLAKGLEQVVDWVAKLTGADLINFQANLDGVILKHDELVASLEKAQKAGDKQSESLYKQAVAYTEAEGKILLLKKSQKELQDELNNKPKNSDDVKSNLIDVNVSLIEQNKILASNKKAYDDVNASLDKSADALKKIPNKTEGAEASTNELADSLKNLSKEFDSLGKTADDALFSLGEEHKAKLDDFKKQLSSIRDEMTKTTSAFESQKGQDQMSVAESVVANQERIAQIQKELAGRMNPEDRSALEAELLEKQTAEQANADFIASIQAQIAEVKRVNALTDMERAIEDYNTKRAMAEAEYSENMSRLGREMKELKKQRDSEKELYQEKVDFIKELDAQTKATLAKSLQDNLLTTKSAIEKEIEMYKALAEAIRSARSGSVAGVERARGSVQSVKDAVISPDGNIISTDPKDYLIATKNPQSLAGGTVVINIENMIGDDQYAEKLGDMIIQNFKMVNRI